MSTVTQTDLSKRIIRATDRITVQHPIFLIYGQPGICKSSLSFSARNPLNLNFDGENGLARAANRRDALDIATIDDLRALRNDPEILNPFTTAVVDTVGRAVDLMALEVIDDTPKYGRNGSLTLQGFGDLKTRFRLWMADLRARQKDILLLSHNKEEKDGDSTCNRPDIQGASLAEVLKTADFVGFLYMNGKSRMLDFNPTERWFGKNPAGWKPFPVPEARKAEEFFARLFDEGREALGRISEGSARIASQIDDWRAGIETWSTAEELNRVLPDIAKLSPLTKSQVVKLLGDRALVLGIPFDKDTKQFTPPVKVVARVTSGGMAEMYS